MGKKRKETPILIPFPVLGVNRGVAASAQPSLTTSDLLNVRALHSGDRVAGGKRPGLVRAMASQAGASGTRRVKSLLAFNNQSQAALADGATTDNVLTPASVIGARDLGAGWASLFPVFSAAAFNPFFQNNVLTITAGVATFLHPGGSIDSGTAISAVEGTVNDAIVELNAIPKADNTGSGNDGPNGGPVRIGPYVRGDARNDAGITLILERTAANEVTPRIRSFSNGAASAVLWTGAAITLSGGAVASSLTLQLQEISSAILRVVISWPSESVAVDLQVSVSTFGDEFHFRSGVFKFGTAGRTHEILSFTVTRVEEATIPSSVQIAGSDPNTEGSDRYFLPDGWTSVLHATAANTITSTVGPAQSALASGIVGTHIDTANSVLTYPGSSGSPNRKFITRTGAVADRLSAIVLFPDIDSGANANVAFSFYSRMNSSFDSYLEVVISVITLDGTASPNNTKQWHTPVSATLNRVIAGVVTSLGTFDFGNLGEVVAHKDNPITIIDTGEATNASIQIRVGGVTVASFSIPDAGIDPATYPALYDGSGVSNKRIAIGQPIATVGSNRNQFRYRFVDTGLNPDGGFNSTSAFGETATYVSAFTDGRVDSALLGAQFSPHSGQSHASGSKISGALLGSKWYTVNSVESLIVDPLNLTAAPWANSITAGTLPLNCALAATYRGRIVIAKQPNNGSIWYMSRTLNPLDFDFNAEPLATAAYAGTNSAIGQPGDTIIALIPHLDDYLLFGCSRSLWFMEGDPGYQGTVQNLARSVGVLGPRAWTFDESERLWFMGNSGLYVLEQIPGRPQLVSGVKLRGILDRVDADTTLIQLAYDAFDKYIYIFLTPADGVSPGIHVCYDTRTGDITDGWFLDQYPLGIGPWAAAEIRGAADANRRVLLAGDDGWVRKHSDLAFDDDGTAINAYFDSAPMEPFSDRVESLAMELNATLFAGSGALTWEWYTADSADEVRLLSTNPVRTGSWGAGTDVGFQFPIGLRERGGAHKLRITQTSSTLSFEMDHAEALYLPVSRRR